MESDWPNARVTPKTVEKVENALALKREMAGAEVG
jgi:hypothetical protein